MTQVALSRAGSKEVELWCEIKQDLDIGCFDFWVINGAWYGQFRDGQLQITSDEWAAPKEDDEGSRWQAEVLWRGKAPFHHEDYDEAIRWIEEQLKPKPPVDPLMMGYREIDFMEVERVEEV